MAISTSASSSAAALWVMWRLRRSCGAVSVFAGSRQQSGGHRPGDDARRLVRRLGRLGGIHAAISASANDRGRGARDQPGMDGRQLGAGGQDRCRGCHVSSGAGSGYAHGVDCRDKTMSRSQWARLSLFCGVGFCLNRAPKAGAIVIQWDHSCNAKQKPKPQA